MEVKIFIALGIICIMGKRNYKLIKTSLLKLDSRNESGYPFFRFYLCF